MKTYIKINKVIVVAFLIVVAALMYIGISTAYSRGKSDGIDEHTLYVNNYEKTYRHATYTVKDLNTGAMCGGQTGGTTHMIKEDITDCISNSGNGKYEVEINWK